MKAWGETDFLLTQALDLHEEMLCPGGCGQYADDAHDDNNEGGFEVQELTCHACAAREQWQADHGGDKRPEPGTLTYVKQLERAPRRRRGASRPH